MEFSKNFSLALKNIRERLGYNQTQMANVCGVHANTYHKYESGDREVDINVINALYFRHQVDPTYFFNLSSPMFLSERATFGDIIRFAIKNAAVNGLVRQALDSKDEGELNQIIEAINKLI